MRKAILLGLALSVAGCAGGQSDTDAAAEQCETFIQSKLKSPSTYKRIKATGSKTPFQNPNNYILIIEYDAANAFGTPIRESFPCTFPLKNGAVDTSGFIDFDAALDVKADNMDAVDEAINGT